MGVSDTTLAVSIVYALLLGAAVGFFYNVYCLIILSLSNALRDALMDFTDRSKCYLNPGHSNELKNSTIHDFYKILYIVLSSLVLSLFQYIFLDGEFRIIFICAYCFAIIFTARICTFLEKISRQALSRLLFVFISVILRIVFLPFRIVAKIIEKIYISVKFIKNKKNIKPNNIKS